MTSNIPSKLSTTQVSTFQVNEQDLSHQNTLSIDNFFLVRKVGQYNAMTIFDFLTDKEKFNSLFTHKVGAIFFMNYTEGAINQLRGKATKIKKEIPSLRDFLFPSTAYNPNLAECFAIKNQARIESGKFIQDIQNAECSPQVKTECVDGILQSRVVLGGANPCFLLRLEQLKKIINDHESSPGYYPYLDGAFIPPDLYFIPLQELVVDCLNNRDYDLAEKIVHKITPRIGGRYNDSYSHACKHLAKEYCAHGLIQKGLESFQKANIYAPEKRYKYKCLFEGCFLGNHMKEALELRRMFIDKAADDEYELEYIIPSSFAEAKANMSDSQYFTLLKAAVSSEFPDDLNFCLNLFGQTRLANAVYKRMWVVCGEPKDLGHRFG
ncbi:MAG: hypothetical protein FJZ57_02115, partial [Chlamydiae bacterium]|nr:hypothetical protein [Chlamydiota bacterium]